MRKVFIAAILAASGSAAWAAGYDDFLRAGAYGRAGNVEKALESYGAALNAGDLAPAYVPYAYMERAGIYLRTGKCAQALTDLDAAVKLRPNLLDALTLRAHAHDCLGHSDAARADLDAMIALAPSFEVYMSRGAFHWFHGDFARAAEDYGTAAGLHNKRSFDWRPGSFSLIWYAISARRAQVFTLADFTAKVKDFDRGPWPGPLVSFFLGTATQEAVYREAAKGGPQPPQELKCEADFFLAEWQIASADPAGKVMLQAVMKNCPNSGITQAAKTDLGRIP